MTRAAILTKRGARDVVRAVVRAVAVFVVFAVSCGAAGAARADELPRITVGSKAFAESWILAEALADLARSAAVVTHRRNLGGTEIVYDALRTGDIDAYVEYTGTIAEVILKAEDRPSLATIRERLAREGIGVSEPLGFNDGYALAASRDAASRLALRTISDLSRHPDVRVAFTHEFYGRKDGYGGLSARYGLALADVRSVQHELAYAAIEGHQVDVTDIYTTDPEIARQGLVLLEDDRGFFPRYDAVILYRADLPARAAAAFASMTRIAGKIDEGKMVRANALVLLDKRSIEEAAEALVTESLGTAAPAPAGSRLHGVVQDIAKNTLRHVELVAVSLLASIAFGVPLGILATRSRALAAVTLSGAGVLQTIPSLALLAFLIPLFGIGVVPALIALFLYSLLPIVRNTYTGLTSIPASLVEAADVLGLPPRAKLTRVMLPMASPTIMAGIKTSAVINVGTATLAALIGAEGLGNPIMEGIALRDTPRILEGAIPAAVLALLVQWGFGLLDRVVVPRGLRASRRS